MIATKKDLERREKKMLAPYAVLSLKTVGREVQEKSDPSRTEFQRDRDRIIHCKAFRRLSGKTQVFVATYGDHFRDRLSHTLEVAQVARDLARNLRLNEDACEAIALAHDLGHPPFGHAGEATLNEIMQEFGLHFEHNEQSKRIVERLEKLFPAFDGLNLTFEVREGLAKHQTLYDQRTKKIKGKTLEAQVVDLADEIAYHNHDLDDGLCSELFSLKEVGKLAVWKQAAAVVTKKHGKIDDPVVLRHRVVSQIISLMIQDVLAEGVRRIKRARVRTLQDALRQQNNCIVFSPSFQKKVAQLRSFLWKKMYQSPRVLTHSRRGQAILKKLFWRLYKAPKLLPRAFYERMQPLGKYRPARAGQPSASERLEVVVKDYVAGCTDAYAEVMLKKISNKS